MKTFLKLIVYNALVLMALVLIIEMIVRALGLHSPNNFVEEVNAYGEIVHYHRPNSRIVMKHEQENIAVFNNLGFHDLPHETDDKNKPNVAYFGDSFVESLQIPTELVFSAKVAAACADSIEVFNFGMSGYGIANQFRLYHRLLSLGQNFDFIYVVFYPGNDFNDNNPRITTHPNYSLVADSTGAIRQINRHAYSPVQRIVKSLLPLSAFVNWIYEVLYHSKRKNVLKESQAESISAKSGLNGGEAGNRYPAVEPEGLEPFVMDTQTTDPIDTAMISGLISIIDKWSEEVGKTRFRMMIIDQERFLRSNVNLKVFLDSLRSIGIEAVPINMAKEEHFYLHPKYDTKGSPVWEDYNYGHFNEAGHRRWADLALKDLEQIRLR
jgi:hypothetical protein